MLNDDILHLVCRQCVHLGPKDSLAAWLSLCRTSKACRQVAQQYVYKEIIWKWDRPGAQPIVGLLNTLARRPELGRLVERLAFRSRRSFHPQGAPFMSTSVEGLVAEAPEIAFRSEWTQLLREGRLDALLALLIFHMPRLRYLHLIRPWEEEPRMLAAVMRHCRFERLTHVEHHLHEHHDAPATADVDLSFYFQQSLERAEFSLARSTLAGHCSSLRSLSLEDTREWQLGLLKGIDLMSFSWRLSGAINWQNNLAVDQLLDALPIGLRRLSVGLELRRLEELRPRIAGDVNKLAALKLDVLSIPILFLSDFGRRWSLDCVPKTVGHLILTDDIGWQHNWQADGEALWQCLQGVRGSKLRVVDVFFGEAGASLKYGRGYEAGRQWMMWAKDFESRLKQFGEKCGIEMHVSLLAGPCDGAFTGW